MGRSSPADGEAPEKTNQMPRSPFAGAGGTRTKPLLRQECG
jgi:hypothetical protein